MLRPDGMRTSTCEGSLNIQEAEAKLIYNGVRKDGDHALGHQYGQSQAFYHYRQCMPLFGAFPKTLSSFCDPLETEKCHGVLWLEMHSSASTCITCMSKVHIYRYKEDWGS